MVGTFHQDDLPVHIGLRAAEVVDELRIVWPNGVTQVLTNVSAGQYLEVTIPSSETVSGDVRSYSIRKEGGSPPGPFKQCSKHRSVLELRSSREAARFPRMLRQGSAPRVHRETLNSENELRGPAAFGEVV